MAAALERTYLIGLALIGYEWREDNKMYDGENVGVAVGQRTVISPE